MHTIYKITVGGLPYFGYTSRPPQERLKEHLDTAYSQKWKHNSKLYPALVEAEYEYDFEVLHQFETEVEALIKEIQLIWETGKAWTLNNSNGGEGSTMNIRMRRFKNGNFSFKASLKGSSKKAARRAARSTPRNKRRRSR